MCTKHPLLAAYRKDLINSVHNKGFMISILFPTRFVSLIPLLCANLDVEKVTDKERKLNLSR